MAPTLYAADIKGDCNRRENNGLPLRWFFQQCLRSLECHKIDLTDEGRASESHTKRKDQAVQHSWLSRSGSSPASDTAARSAQSTGLGLSSSQSQFGARWMSTINSDAPRPHLLHRRADVHRACLQSPQLALTYHTCSRKWPC